MSGQFKVEREGGRGAVDTLSDRTERPASSEFAVTNSCSSPTTA